MKNEHIIKMEEDYILFAIMPYDEDEIENKKDIHCIEIPLPRMPSLPEGYKVKIYGDLVHKFPTEGEPFEKVYYIKNLRGKTRDDLVIYRAYVRYLKGEKEIDDIKSNVEGGLEELQKSLSELSDKMKELYTSVTNVRDKLRLIALKKEGNTLQ
jgi:hypothetical protein